jgi:hypothetical protein
MRHFRSTETVYEQVRAALDAAWRLPNALGTQTCIEPSATAPRDAQGLVVLAVHDEFASWEPAATLLPQLLLSGQAEEITASEYQAALASNPD